MGDFWTLSALNSSDIFFSLLTYPTYAFFEENLGKQVYQKHSCLTVRERALVLCIFIRSLYVPPMHPWVLSQYWSFLPQSKTMHKLMTNLSLIVTVCGCKCGPLLNRSIQGVPRLCLTVTERLQQPLKKRLKRLKSKFNHLLIYF